MASTGSEETIAAVKAYLATDAGLSAAGIYNFEPPREDVLPCTVIALQPINRLRALSGTAWNEYRLHVKHMAVNNGGTAAMKPLKDAAYSLLMAGQSPLNALLATHGFAVAKILDDGDIPFYTDSVGGDKDVKRAHLGMMYQIRVIGVN